VERIVTKAATGPDSSTLTATRFGYAKNGRTVVYVLGESWTYGATCPNDNYAITYAREFRYDSARARYLNRELDPAGLMASPQEYTVLSENWSHYDEDDIYADFTVSGSATTTARYEPGLWNTEGGAGQYLHDDDDGTLRLTTDSSGMAGTLRVFTAFGERLAGPNDRFGYLGFWGLQHLSSDSAVAAGGTPPAGFFDAGGQLYDSASGRTLQRVPGGIFGGLNVYCASGPPSPANSAGAGAAKDPRGVIETFDMMKSLGGQSAKEAAKEAATQAAKKPKAGVLRRLWEKVWGKKWPKDPKTGKPQDVHHKKPRADGGRDTVDNIEPKPHDKHISDHSKNGDFSRWARRRGNMNCGPGGHSK
jgi:hypothetical protein